MSAPVVSIHAVIPRDGRRVEFVDDPGFDPHSLSQIVRDLRTGHLDIVPTAALIVHAKAVCVHADVWDLDDLAYGRYRMCCDCGDLLNPESGAL